MLEQQQQSPEAYVEIRVTFISLLHSPHPFLSLFELLTAAWLVQGGSGVCQMLSVIRPLCQEGLTLHFIPGSCKALVALKAALTELKTRNSGCDGEIKVTLHLAYPLSSSYLQYLGIIILCIQVPPPANSLFSPCSASSSNLLSVLIQSRKHFGKMYNTLLGTRNIKLSIICVYCVP